MNVFDLPVHPAADIFPMLDKDELKELAADIKANGLAHPIVVKDGVVIDGRNRREACRLVGVEPQTVELNGQDPAAYILSANINRRHMTKSQRAMATAMLSPEPGRGGRGKKNSKLNLEFSIQYISQARTVLKWTPEIAAAVLAGTKPLNEAYEEAKALKERADELPARLKRLRELAPDLADLVHDEKLTINEGMAAAEKRKSDERVRRQGVWDFLHQLESLIRLMEVPAQVQDVIDVCNKFPNEWTGRQPVKTILKVWINGLASIERKL
jgi:hypothetical protein